MLTLGPKQGPVWPLKEPMVHEQTPTESPGSCFFDASLVFLSFTMLQYQEGPLSLRFVSHVFVSICNLRFSSTDGKYE